MRNIWHTAWMKAISVVVLLVWMFVISGFSAQTGEESSSVSMAVSEWVAESYSAVVEPQLSEEQVQAIAIRIEFPVRKIAHFSEYGIMACLAWYVLFCFGYRRWKNGIVVLFCFLYASVDEMHQLFVNGRSSRFTDVCIDTSGAFLAMLIVFLVQVCYDKHCCRKKLVQP